MDNINLLSGGSAKNDIVGSREEDNIINWSKLDLPKKKKGSGLFFALFGKAGQPSPKKAAPTKEKQVFSVPAIRKPNNLPPLAISRKPFWKRFFFSKPKKDVLPAKKTETALPGKRIENSLLYKAPAKILAAKEGADNKAGQINLLTKTENEIISQDLKAVKDEKTKTLNGQAQAAVDQKLYANRGILDSYFKKEASSDGPVETKKPITSKDIFNKKIKWENPRVLQSNLMAEEVVSYIDWGKNITVAVVFAILSLVVLGSAYWGLDTQKKQEEAILIQYKERLAAIENMINKIAESNKETEIVKQKVNIASTILDNHIYWTNFFKFLEENSIPEVVYKDFNGDTTGNYTLSVSAKSFADVTKLVRAMKSNSLVKNVWVDSASNSRDSVGFTLNISIDPSVFYKGKE